MQYLTTPQLADRLDKSPYTIQKWVAAGQLPGRKLGGTWVTTSRELRDYLRGEDVEDITLVELYDLKAAAEELGLSVPAVRRMIRDKKLKGKHIDSRGQGKNRGTLVFNNAQLNRAKQHVEYYTDATPGRPVKGDADSMIYSTESGGVTWWHIRDTLREDGCDRHYKHRNQARQRAREVLEKPLRYCAGDKVLVYLPGRDEGDRAHQAYIKQDVTAICGAAMVDVRDPESSIDGEELLVTLDEIVERLS